MKKPEDQLALADQELQALKDKETGKDKVGDGDDDDNDDAGDDDDDDDADAFDADKEAADHAQQAENEAAHVPDVSPGFCIFNPESCTSV